MCPGIKNLVFDAVLGLFAMDAVIVENVRGN